jgi:AraC-like DNA-binding protein
VGEIKAIMSAASQGTCHACEQPVQANGGDLEFFRPRQMAGNARKDGKSPDHYWWLSYDWDNLQLLCPMCNRCKASLFPIKGERALIDIAFASGYSDPAHFTRAFRRISGVSPRQFREQFDKFPPPGIPPAD